MRDVMSDPLLVSIRCTVYNHEKYLRQCLDGFVMQKTSFRFEAFVHDDASTDESAAIILEYAQKYPSIIKPYIEKSNLYSKRDGSFTRITYSKEFLQGKYVALCEGDDYWTDPYKLQKQVDYMDNHPECSMCFGSAVEHWEDHVKPDKLFSHIENRDYSGVELSNKWIVPTASILFRQTVIDSPLFKRFLENRRIMAGDLSLCLCCAELGTIHAFSDVFCVYRRSPHGFWRSLDSAGRMRMGDERIELYHLFGKKYKESTISIAFYHYQRCWQLAKDEQNTTMRRAARNRLFFLFFHFPKLGLRHLSNILKERK